MKRYRALLNECTIVPDSSFKEGYIVRPGIDLRLPEKSIAIKIIEVRIVDGCVVVKLGEKENCCLVAVSEVSGEEGELIS